MYRLRSVVIVSCVSCAIAVGASGSARERAQDVKVAGNDQEVSRAGVHRSGVADPVLYADVPFSIATDKPQLEQLMAPVLVRSASSMSIPAPPVCASSANSGVVPANPTMAQVDDDGAECPGAGFATIQAAIDSGADIIEVCAGTYAEDVAITAGSYLSLYGTGAVTVTGTGGAGPIIDVSGGGWVELSTLTVDGGGTMTGGTVYGVRYSDTDGVVADVSVLNVRNPTGSSQGIGIRAQSTGTPSNVTVRDSLVDNYTRVGINGNGLGLCMSVLDNQINGPIDPRVWAPNGVQIARGAVGRVAGNFVDNNPSPNPPGGAGSGILLFCAGPVDVSGNDVEDADLGITLADTEGSLVIDNVVRDSQFDGISLQVLGDIFGPLGCPNEPAKSPTKDNRVAGNSIDNSADTGISSAVFDSTGDQTLITNNLIDGNTITNSGFDGIHWFDGSLNVITSNDMSSSGGDDAADDTVGGGTAGTDNTWSGNNCTTSTPAGLCN